MRGIGVRKAEKAGGGKIKKIRPTVTSLLIPFIGLVWSSVKASQHLLSVFLSTCEGMILFRVKCVRSVSWLMLIRGKSYKSVEGMILDLFLLLLFEELRCRYWCARGIFCAWGLGRLLLKKNLGSLLSLRQGHAFCVLGEL